MFHYLHALLLKLAFPAGGLLRVDYDPPLRRPLKDRILGALSGRGGMPSIFHEKYLIYWVEVFVILTLVLFVAYVAFTLRLHKREG